MSNFKRIGGRYGFHSGSGKFKNAEVTSQFFVQGANIGPMYKKVLFVDVNAGGAGNGDSWDNAYTTIQAAVTAATTEGNNVTTNSTTLILVAPGKYKENVIIPGRITSGGVIVTRGCDGIYLKAICGSWETQWRSGDATTKHAFTDTNAEAGSAAAIGLFVGARSVTVDGFCFDGGGGNVGVVVGDGYGVGDALSTSYNSASCRIINCLFRAGNEGTNIPALVLKGCSDNVIVENNVFKECDYGVYISSGSGKTNQAPIIRNNHFIGCSTYGVYKCNENTDLNVQVIGNTFLDGSGGTMTFAVKLQGTGQHFMAGNHFGCTNSESLSLTDFASGNFLSVTGKTNNVTYVTEG